jgi:xanthine dehydrogenase YagR molybdenum-binding subunit
MTLRIRIDAPEAEDRIAAMEQGVIGAPLDRPEGPLKVSGRAPYAAEVLPEGVAFGVFVHATVAKGRLARLGDEAVRALPGVLDVISNERFLRNPAQGGAGKAPVQGATDIAYVGQPIALVVAETFEAARHAAQAMRPRFEPEDGAVVDPEAADAKLERPDSKQSDQGDIEAAMAAAAFTVDATYRTPPHASAAMEPHAAVAVWDGDRLELRGGLQMLAYNRKELADALGIAPENVRLLAPYVGGGFGSKLGISPECVAAAIAAKRLGRPVAVALSRQQVFEAVMRRSETRQRIRLAADADGRLTGIGHESLVSNLPGESFSEPVAQATHFLYAGENRRVVHEIARVHRTCAGSVRAPGEAVGVTALENAMDELAEAADLDPVELRLRSIPERHPEEGKPFSSHTLARALRQGAESFGWSRRNPVPGQVRDGEWLVGLGMASAVRVNMLAEAQARVTLFPDRALVESDMTDIGTGTYAILRQVAGEMLGLPAEAVDVRLGDTDLPPGPGSGGSWGAASTGGAVFFGCESLRERIVERLGAKGAELTLRDGRAIAGNRAGLLAEMVDPEGWSAVGHLVPGKVNEAVRQATFGAHFAEVGVNAFTGETRVRRMLGVFAAGRILNEKTARSQCFGGMTFGIGMALTEAIHHDPRDGHIVNRDLAEYHLPVNRDVPQLEVEFLDERDPWSGPLQAKGIGELSICGAAAAVTNAIHNACGVRVRDYPATLDKILAGLG